MVPDVLADNVVNEVDVGRVTNCWMPLGDVDFASTLAPGVRRVALALQVIGGSSHPDPFAAVALEPEVVIEIEAIRMPRGHFWDRIHPRSVGQSPMFTFLRLGAAHLQRPQRTFRDSQLTIESRSC